MPVHRQWVNEAAKGQIKKYLEKMEIHTAKVIGCISSTSEKEIHINTYLKKQESSQINDLTSHLNEPVFLRQTKSVAPGTCFMMNTWIMFPGSINKCSGIFTPNLFSIPLTLICGLQAACVVILPPDFPRVLLQA